MEIEINMLEATCTQAQDTAYSYTKDAGHINSTINNGKHKVIKIGD